MRVKIFDNGYLYKIVIPKDCTYEERYAADMLKKYLDKISGSSIPLITDCEKENYAPHNFFVGRTLSAATFFAAEREKLDTDEFIIKPLRGDIYLFDRADAFSSSGVIYAAEEFLEKFLGVRFFCYDEEYVPTFKKIEFDVHDVYGKPDFLMRQHLAAATRKYPDYAVKMRIKDCFCPDTPGGDLYPLWAKGKMWHNFFELIPPEKYKKDHPEWFDEKSEQLCFASESLTDEIFEVMKKKIEENPQSRFFALSQNDTDKPCQCEKCRELYEKYTVSGALIRFVNRVAVKIEKWLKNTYPERKDVYITTFAYYFSVEPPVRKVGSVFVPIDESVVPNKNVYIFYTTIDNCFYHFHDDKTCEWNKNFSDRINGWKSLVGDRFIYWTYSSNFVHYLYPFFNFHTMAHNFRLLKEAGGRYILDQASCENEFVNFSELRTYVSAKLLWDVNADEKKLADEFIDAYYKNAAPFVKEYIRLFKEHLDYLAEERDYHLRVFALPDSMFDFNNFPLEFIGRLEKVFADGFDVLKARNIEENSEEYKRFRRVYLYVKYLYVINYKNYFPCDTEETKIAFIDGFIAECKALGINRYKEYFKDNMDEFREKAVSDGLLKY